MDPSLLVSCSSMSDLTSFWVRPWCLRTSMTSSGEMEPSPSRSNSLKARITMSSFSSLLMCTVAARNSCQSMVPSPFWSAALISWSSWSSGILLPMASSACFSSWAVMVPFPSASMLWNRCSSPESSAGDRHLAMTPMAAFLKRLLAANCWMRVTTTLSSGASLSTSCSRSHSCCRAWLAVRRLVGSLISSCSTRFLACGLIVGQGADCMSTCPRRIILKICSSVSP
mmetsp:Transcript_12722/g.38368  ORF Transcript_12722/g.38368 Transcript_12722/m.38368 type:complete len:227 (+) Transcript_12722:1651-2331(+)